MILSRTHKKLVILTLSILILSAGVFAGMRQLSNGFDDWWGPRYSAQAERTAESTELTSPLLFSLSATTGVRRWNEIAINASGLDHTPVAPGENRVFGENLGPGRASRAIAIVHIAIFDAVNAIDGSCKSFCGISRAAAGTSMEAAIAQAAHDTLVVLFPSQKLSFDLLLADDLNRIVNSAGKTKGITLGRLTAKTILGLRSADGAQHPEPRVGTDFIPSDDAGKWRQDPVSLIPLALGAHWDQVKPFVLTSPQQFRAPAPPAMDSPAYAAAFDEVKRLGGDGVITATERTAEQTQIGIYWGYDGTPSLCAPPRLYNQIAIQLAEQMGSSPVELARLLALINVAMSDAGSAIWESKYFYQVWRPITGIREADPGTGPTGAGDGNPDTTGDPTFMPFGAPASNLTGPDFTPPFPAYPSGHAGFGGALFQILRNFYGTDNIPFTFMSDEFNGVTLDNHGNPRPLLPRSFSTLSQAEEENGQSRIYLGIHWSYDKTEGIAQGRRVADYVFKRAFAKLKK